MYDGLGGSSEIFRLSNAQSRSISPENKTGERGAGALCPLEQGSARNAARDLGTGWKVNPFEIIEPGQTIDLADIKGMGAIRHIWMTLMKGQRYAILRFFWDDQETPSVECPAGDFFCTGWGKYADIRSDAVCVNPNCGFNCYWTMPFRKRCRITMENISEENLVVYYQIDYMLTDALPDDTAYFCAQFRRENPLPYLQPYTILDGVRGKGHFVGTYLAWGVNNNGWWGEGEIKFYLDGEEHPTICGTGTEDYFCGSYDFSDPEVKNSYRSFSTPYAGFYVVNPDDHYQSQMRFGMYRWHMTDPIRFEKELKVTIQALGWRDGGRYLSLQDDISSVAFWYQTLPTAVLPGLPGKDRLEII